MERAEKIGLGIATAGHVLLFGMLSLGFLRAPDPLKFNNPPMDVSIVDDVALRSSAPKIAQEAPPPGEAPELGSRQEAAPAPEPVPVIKVAPQPVLRPEPAPKAKPVEKARPLPKVAAPAPASVKPVPAKSVAARPAPAKPAEKPASGAGSATVTRSSRLKLDPSKWMQADGGTGATPSAKPSAGTPAAVIGPAQKAALDAEIRRQLKPYWKSPTGADVEQLRTTVDVRLARDGSIIGDPQVVDTLGVTPSNQGQVRLHRELAVKAIRLAAPFTLPADLYAGWKSLRISFDKRLSQ